MIKSRSRFEIPLYGKEILNDQVVYVSHWIKIPDFFYSKLTFEGHLSLLPLPEGWNNNKDIQLTFECHVLY